MRRIGFHKFHKKNPNYSVTSNLSQALDALGASKTAQSLKTTRSLDEALGCLSKSTAFHPQPEDTLQATIRGASSPADLDHLYRLVHDAYVEQGYVDLRADGRLLFNAEFDNRPETTVLIVEGAGVLLGSISLTLDGPHGLPVDKDFNATCNLIRKEGRTLASVWRLVTRHGHADERRLVMTLIGEVTREAVNRGVQTSLCAVNPKHEHFYKRLLSMNSVACSRGTRGLKNAPGVCMRCDIENVPEWWTR
jgi:hypothetical protein